VRNPDVAIGDVGWVNNGDVVTGADGITCCVAELLVVASSEPVDDVALVTLVD